MRLTVVKSPVNGVVATIAVGVGDSVAPQQLLMNVVPENLKLAAEIYVPSRAAGFVQAGQSVRIAYDAFPQQKFGTFDGRVDRVSDFVLLPGEIPQTFPLLEATYKVRIEISESAIPTSVGTLRLRPGMLLAAEIVLEQRDLVDWLLEPLRFRRSSHN
jgi:membrane fusion protein